MIYLSLLQFIKIYYNNPLPFCEVLKPLDMYSPALNTLANCLHLIVTIRDQ